MKIFNWMHRKLHPGVIRYSQVSHKKDVSGGDEEMEKREVLLEGLMAEKEALLLHDVLNGAILAIGTLGRDDCRFLPQFFSAEEDDGVFIMPLAADKEENLNVMEEVEEKEELQVKETVAPEFAADSAAVESVKFKAPQAAGQEEWSEKQRKKIVQEMAMQADSAEEAERIQELPLLKEDREKRERGRTTLADLFAADHSFAAIYSSAFEMNGNDGVNDKIKLKQHAAANCSEKKKTEKNKKEEKWTSDTIKTSNNSSNSNRKIQKLVTKMLKKKIHPEIPGAQKATAACNCKERD